MSLFDQTNIYADLGTCHGGDEAIAKQLIMQTFNAGAIPKIQLYSEKTWPRDWVVGPPFVASVFRPADVDYIMPFQPLALKIASVEATYRDLILACLQTDLPLIVSTGGMDEDEILKMIEIAIPYNNDLCLMHCVSIYPTPPEQVNLGRLAALGEMLDKYAPFLTLGWSSHCPQMDVPMVAMAYAYGATQFEVHVRPKRIKLPWTLDEQSSLDVEWLHYIRGFLESCEKYYGDDSLTGPDREAVLEWRKRWQE